MLTTFLPARGYWLTDIDFLFSTERNLKYKRSWTVHWLLHWKVLPGRANSPYCSWFLVWLQPTGGQHFPLGIGLCVLQPVFVRGPALEYLLSSAIRVFSQHYQSANTTCDRLTILKKTQWGTWLWVLRIFAVDSIQIGYPCDICSSNLSRVHDVDGVSVVSCRLPDDTFIGLSKLVQNIIGVWSFNWWSNWCPVPRGGGLSILSSW